MTARPRAVLAALALAGAALLTSCGPAGHPAPGAADTGQVQDMRHKLDAADSAADQADTDAAADGN
ncbi:hypothetical protein PUR71_04415 [Streptomyces sp. SP17BM10]|uniref:hypothetical protein n=1 Tax=Streptomyces sp. SP17BM10 TaxID=3002530 RepID=UPI002E78C2DD|nr:hypothetical protein [Streptomyces sp. SP17BM10]MEE1782174.1 hypothetical protein [Streptomyces sp. SP17BM10]